MKGLTCATAGQGRFHPWTHIKRGRREWTPTHKPAWDFMMLQKVLEAAVLELYDRQ